MRSPTPKTAPSDPGFDPKDAADRDVAHLLRHLRDLVEDSDRSMVSIDRALGRSRGWLEQVLAGRIDLRYRTLLEILDALGSSPLRLLARTFPSARPRTRQAIEQLTIRPPVAEIYAFGVDEILDLQRRVERAECVLRRSVRTAAGSAD